MRSGTTLLRGQAAPGRCRSPTTTLRFARRLQPRTRSQCAVQRPPASRTGRAWQGSRSALSAARACSSSEQWTLCRQGSRGQWRPLPPAGRSQQRRSWAGSPSASGGVSSSRRPTRRAMAPAPAPLQPPHQRRQQRQQQQQKQRLLQACRGPKPPRPWPGRRRSGSRPWRSPLPRPLRAGRGPAPRHGSPNTPSGNQSTRTPPRDRGAGARRWPCWTARLLR
mmetsp:Transcript_15688/g.59527  ORF Transcript_15688/g.59527 Transcript_15688/m.59527 type:complete len:222 (-) Transcript_15688:1658-2323(-)